MKAVAVVPSKKELRLVDHPMPQINDGNQIKVQRLMSEFVAPTAKYALSFTGRRQGDDYLVLGHG